MTLTCIPYQYTLIQAIQPGDRLRELELELADKAITNIKEEQRVADH